MHEAPGSVLHGSSEISAAKTMVPPASPKIEAKPSLRVLPRLPPCAHPEVRQNQAQASALEGQFYYSRILI